MGSLGAAGRRVRAGRGEGGSSGALDDEGLAGLDDAGSRLAPVVLMLGGQLPVVRGPAARLPALHVLPVLQPRVML